MIFHVNPLAAVIAVLASLVLAGCGGGGTVEATVVTVAPPPPQFLFWAGSTGGSQVIDGGGRAFAFFADSGCLFNAQTGQENTAFCLAPGSNFVNYGAFHGQVANVLVSNGTCQAAIIDSSTGNFIDIQLDTFGREVILTTQLHPAICLQ